MDIIKIDGLKKSFGEIQAVNDLSFRVKEGETFAFLGVNGAGKSTTISILCGLLEMDAGEIFIDGENLKGGEAWKGKLGVVFQDSLLDKALNVKENLEIRAGLYGICGEEFSSRLTQLTKLLDLKPILRRTVGKLSGGQRRRVDIARALLHKPKILILDEPTTGLDPQTRKTVWEVIEKLKKDENVTVFLTTHYMEEAANADYVVILDAGKIVSEGTPRILKNEFARDYLTLYNVSETDVKTLGLPYETLNDGYRVALKHTAEATELIKTYPNLFVDYEIVKGKMDDVFLAVTGKKLDGGESK